MTSPVVTALNPHSPSPEKAILQKFIGDGDVGVAVLPRARAVRFRHRSSRRSPAWIKAIYFVLFVRLPAEEVQDPQDDRGLSVVGPFGLWCRPLIPPASRELLRKAEHTGGCTAAGKLLMERPEDAQIDT